MLGRISLSFFIEIIKAGLSKVVLQYFQARRDLDGYLLVQ